MKTCKTQLLNVLFIMLLMQGCAAIANSEQSHNSVDWFYPEWAATAKYNQPIQVVDTESALGRYATQTKTISLKDLARMHGHLCDGLVIAFVEIKAVLYELFPDGKVDRTDIRAVSKNGPCWVDAVAFMTGARINFKTLRIDNSIGDGYIIQKIPTGETYEVHLKPGIFPESQTLLEHKIRSGHANGQSVNSKDLQLLEQMASVLSRKLLNTAPDNLLDIKPLANYQFIANDLFGSRGDVINKALPR